MTVYYMTMASHTPAWLCGAVFDGFLHSIPVLTPSYVLFPKARPTAS
jgi:hypothetical protein